MPLYEYECYVCDHRFERIQRVSDSPSSECPKCGGAVRRLLGVPALQFKGTGFYITDYAKGNGNGAEPDTREQPATEKKAEKPAKKEPKKTESASAGKDS
jgi:putative FmdB family regulatory protein